MGGAVKVISINLRAGTAEFITDIEKAKTGLKDFGAHAQQAGAHSVSAIQATSGALRVLEGSGGIRAAERFIATTLNLGPALQAAFPIVGGLAFGSMLKGLSTELYDFYKQIQAAPAKIDGSFRELTAPLRATNDQLQVAIDKTQQEIDKLQGKHTNNLKLTLDEAVVSADKLAESLSKDLTALQKLLKEENVGYVRRFLGEAKTKDIQEQLFGEDKFAGHGGFTGQIEDITSRGQEQIAAAARSKDSAAQKKAQDQLDGELRYAYDEQINKLKNEAKNIADRKAHYAALQKQLAESRVPAAFGTHAVYSENTQDTEVREKALEGAIRYLEGQRRSVGLNRTNDEATARKNELQAGAQNAQIDRPFNDRIKALAVQLEQAKAKLNAAGLDESGKVVAKGYENAVKAIEEVNKALEKYHIHLTDAQMGQISSAEQTIAATTAEADWKTKLESSTAAIQERIKAQQLLTDAIGKGYEAVRNANVEGQVMTAVGPEKYSDPKWMAAHLDDVERIRAGQRAQYDAQHNNAVAQTVDRLGDQVKMEQALLAVQDQGREIVERLTLAYRISDLQKNGATREQVALEIKLFEIEQQRQAKTELTSINDRIAAVRAETDAVVAGAEAQRKAILDVKYAQMEAHGGRPEIINATRNLDELENRHKITEEAAKAANTYRDQLFQIDQQIEATRKLRSTAADQVGVEIQLRNLTDQRLQLLVQQSLAMGRAKDGLRAFFLEMQRDGEKTSQVIYDALMHSVDGLSQNLAKAMTGQKTAWADTFKSISTDLLQSSIKKELQKEIGSFGKALGFDTSGLVKADGSTEAQALWVRMAGGGFGANGTVLPGIVGVAGPSSSSATTPTFLPGGKIPGLGQNDLGGQLGKMLASFLGKRRAKDSLAGISADDLDQLTNGGGDSSFLSDLDFSGLFADGGSIPSGSYGIAGERGPELIMGPSTVVSNKQAFGGGDTHHHTYNIDARGAQLGVEGRVAAAIDAAHASAVNLSAKNSHDMQRRMPAKSHS